MPNPSELSSAWYTGTVQRGDQVGRTLGFPTANLDPVLLEHVKKEGVYAAEVRLGSQFYRGALYLGPRLTLGETKRVLEIHLLDFSGDIYGQDIHFCLGPFIRPSRDFPNIEELVKCLKADTDAVRGKTDN